MAHHLHRNIVQLKMRKVGMGRPNPLNQYNLSRPGTYTIVILVQKKNICTN